VTLLAADHLWKCGLPEETLSGIGLQVGSDVPFFLRGGNALGERRGEHLTPGDWPSDYWILLLCPGFPVSTAWAYREARIALTNEEKFANFRALFKSYAPNDLKHLLINDLEDAVFTRYPELRLLKTQLYGQGAFYAGMSGSGSTIFGLFQTSEQAKAAESFFPIHKGMKTFLCRPVSASPFTGNAP
jgi:4-diphosphocytidyl-2-C-methyl-D-erythritol kinase